MPHLELSAIGDWGQLIFVLVALIGWIIKTIVETREERARQDKRNDETKQQKQPSRLRRGFEATAKALAEGFLDVETEEKPPPPPPQRAHAHGAPEPIELEAPVPPSPPVPRARSLVADELGRDLTTETVGGRTLVRLKSSGVAAVVSQTSAQIRRRRAMRRLGIRRREERQALRTAILWSEVIGMPRYAKGPHRSPAAERMRRKR